jgi:hypothetical protein
MKLNFKVFTIDRSKFTCLNRRLLVLSTLCTELSDWLLARAFPAQGTVLTICSPRYGVVLCTASPKVVADSRKLQRRLNEDV